MYRFAVTLVESSTQPCSFITWAFVLDKLRDGIGLARSRLVTCGGQASLQPSWVFRWNGHLTEGE